MENKIDLKERSNLILYTVKIFKVMSILDIASILECKSSYISRIINFHIPEIKKIRISETNTRSIFIYYVDELTETKRELISKKYQNKTRVKKDKIRPIKTF